jgi:hypothetical protein
MGLITRQELSVALRQELDDVYNYIAGSNNAEMGTHMANMNNPHNVTKEQIGLGLVPNYVPAREVDLLSHAQNNLNPHNVTASQVGAVPTTRNLLVGTGLTGGGTLSANRTFALDTAYTDARYLLKGAKASDADKLDGLSSSAFHKVGSRFIDMGAGREIYYGGTTNNFYFRQEGHYDRRVYHDDNITRGTANPSGGMDGDIYIQY